MILVILLLLMQDLHISQVFFSFKNLKATHKLKEEQSLMSFNWFFNLVIKFHTGNLHVKSCGEK